MLLIQFLNALQFSMTLFLLAVGLTIIFGLMKIVNLAHGSLYMIGAYIGLSIWSYFDSFWLALIISPTKTKNIAAFQKVINEVPGSEILRFWVCFVGVISLG